MQGASANVGKHEACCSPKTASSGAWNLHNGQHKPEGSSPSPKAWVDPPPLPARETVSRRLCDKTTVSSKGFFFGLMPSKERIRFRAAINAFKAWSPWRPSNLRGVTVSTCHHAGKLFEKTMTCSKRLGRGWLWQSFRALWHCYR